MSLPGSAACASCSTLTGGIVPVEPDSVAIASTSWLLALRARPQRHYLSVPIVPIEPAGDQ
jgi:hypothetical protein